MNTLITIPFSHFCEKARWALDWCGVPYVERACLPGLASEAHEAHRRPHGAGARSRRRQPPLTDSTAILRWADAHAPAHKRLLPASAAARAERDALEDELDERLGPATRLWAYAHGLRNRPMLRALVAPSFPRWRDRALLALARCPSSAPIIERHYGATTEAAERAEGVIVDGFERAAQRLSKQPYLSGERFGAADLTFAVLGGAMVLPPREPAHEARRRAAAARCAPSSIGCARRRAGEHAARCYREHRYEPRQTRCAGNGVCERPPASRARPPLSA